MGIGSVFTILDVFSLPYYFFSKLLLIAANVPILPAAYFFFKWFQDENEETK